ncbi:hypothetical protein EUGRSUZ_D02115 [Eucalyptus grandis]|uniref:Uncharacterized protein n=1 Tax=Eucalyptus grandis TaxID=71139 RepID=A0A059CHG7_EUCGR|nr:hypothetical protein EUGRSUZ_D02115 [Eucalyptus grandis]
MDDLIALTLKDDNKEMPHVQVLLHIAYLLIGDLTLDEINLHRKKNKRHYLFPNFSLICEKQDLLQNHNKV